MVEGTNLEGGSRVAKDAARFDGVVLGLTRCAIGGVTIVPRGLLRVA